MADDKTSKSHRWPPPVHTDQVRRGIQIKAWRAKMGKNSIDAALDKNVRALKNGFPTQLTGSSTKTLIKEPRRTSRISILGGSWGHTIAPSKLFQDPTSLIRLYSSLPDSNIRTGDRLTGHRGKSQKEGQEDQGTSERFGVPLVFFLFPGLPGILFKGS